LRIEVISILQKNLSLIRMVFDERIFIDGTTREIHLISKYQAF
jgi:hypothetical protein